MRPWVLLALLLPCMAAAQEGPTGSRCPRGTTLRETFSVDQGESASWCARPDGTRHGPASLSRFSQETGEEVSASGEYREGKRHGLWKLKTSELEEEGYFRDGVKEGPWTEYLAPEGVAKGLYRAGKKHGPWTWWFDNGMKQKAARIPFRKGLKHGRATYYGPNVPPKVIAFKNGKEVAAWDEKGRRMKRRPASTKKAPAKKAPVKKAPVKKAPAKKAAAASSASGKP